MDFHKNDFITVTLHGAVILLAVSVVTGIIIVSSMALFLAFNNYTTVMDKTTLILLSFILLSWLTGKYFHFINKYFGGKSDASHH